MGAAQRDAALAGFAIGLANLVWLYAAYFLGLHTRGIGVFQIFMAIWLAITVAGFFLAHREFAKRHPHAGHGGRLQAGAVMAFASGAMAAVAQVGYFTVVHPEWPTVMTGQAREHFVRQGLSPEAIEREVEAAKKFFTVTNYAVSSAVTAFVLGLVLTAAIVLWRRHRPNPRAGESETPF